MLLRIPVPACAGVVAGASRTPPQLQFRLVWFGSVCRFSGRRPRSAFLPLQHRSVVSRPHLRRVRSSHLSATQVATDRGAEGDGLFSPTVLGDRRSTSVSLGRGRVATGAAPPPMAGCRGAPEAPPALAAASPQAPPLTARLLLLFGVRQARLCFPPRREACS